MNLTVDEKKEILRELKEAQASLLDIVNTLSGIARRTENSNKDAYIVAPLKIIASSKHEFISRDMNLDDWIEELEEDINEMD